MARRRCGSGDICFAPAREGGWLCEEHAAIIHEIAGRPEPQSKSGPKKVGNPYAKQDQALAAKLAAEVHKAEGSEAELAERVGLRVSSDQFAAVVDIAVRNEWVREVNGLLSGGSKQPLRSRATPPPKVPVRVRAEQLARLVRAAGHPVTRTDAARALGVSASGGFPRVAAFARDREWIATVRGADGGYVPGSAAPPQAVAA